MARIHCDFFSETLGLCTAMNVILPQATQRQIGMTGHSSGEAHPTLWLLHGLSDDHTIWLRRTSIERYAAKYGYAVVMPAVGRSFYTNMHAGLDYWDFISEELPAIARSFFPLSERREDNFVAGLSMGGYGAFKLAMHHPDRYAAAASLSGVMDFEDIMRDYPGRDTELQNIFGDLDALSGSEHDLYHLASRLTQSAVKPALFLCCGEEDHLYHSNTRYIEHLDALGMDYTWQSDAGHAHTWDYWDIVIQRVLRWIADLRR